MQQYAALIFFLVEILEPDAEISAGFGKPGAKGYGGGAERSEAPRATPSGGAMPMQRGAGRASEPDQGAITRAGMPATVAPAGTSRVTTALAPIRA